MVGYQRAWDWLKSNKGAPFTTVLYVSSIALVVHIKNVFTESKHEIMIEVYKEGEKAPYTEFFLPRICITRYAIFEEKLSNLLQNTFVCD